MSYNKELEAYAKCADMNCSDCPLYKDDTTHNIFRCIERMSKILKRDIDGYVANSKFKVGDAVRRYITTSMIKGDIICPLCNGLHRVPNPNLEVETSSDGYASIPIVCPYCDEHGKYQLYDIPSKKLSNSIYLVESVSVTRSEAGYRYRYTIHTCPEVDPEFLCHETRTVDEDELELV